MYRGATSRFRFFKGGAANEGSVIFSRGFFSWLTGGRSKSLPALDFPLKDIRLPSPLPEYVEPSKTQITTLQNGVKIASETSQNPAASIGLYVNSGSIYETYDSIGVTNLLERMAFKTTTNRSHLRVVREVESIGGNIGVSASRDQMSYTFDAIKSYVPEMVEILVDSVRNPAFLEWEVSEELDKLKSQIAEASNNPQGLLLEAIHTAGFSGPLANPLLAPESALSRLNSAVLEQFVLENYTASRMVLAASGVDHDDLVSVAEPILCDMPSESPKEEPKSKYIGGDYRCQADSGVTHLAFAFEYPGGWSNDKDGVMLTVLQMLMGGGGSFSAGGPGKGMYSRLYLRVLNEHKEVQSFSAFSNIYNNTSLFGIHASTGSDFVPKIVDITAHELTTIAKHGEVNKVQLNRAKESTKSAILMNLESRAIVSEDIGRQVMAYGKRKPVEHFLELIDSITADDIALAVQKLLSSRLTLAAYGDVAYVPSYDLASSKFVLK